MADAVSVLTPSKPLKVAPEVIPFGDTKPEELLAKAQAIVEAGKPVRVLDEQVNQIGQESSYGKIKRVTEVPYDQINRKGEPTGKVLTHLKIDH